jgi:hypothetical protein
VSFGAACVLLLITGAAVLEWIQAWSDEEDRLSLARENAKDLVKLVANLRNALTQIQTQEGLLQMANRSFYVFA